MLTIPPASEPESVLLEWVRNWLDLLALGHLAEACARLDPPPDGGRRWTPEAITALVTETFGPGTRFRVDHPEGPVFTPVATARGRAHPHVGAFADGSGYWVNHDVPLNGEYSDLTAQLEFIRQGDALAVVLHDLHVM